MQISLGMSIPFRQSVQVSQQGEVTDPAVSAIDTEGWRATYASPPTFDPRSDPKYVVTLSPGYNSAGSSATVTRNLVLMSRVRQPFPNQASLTATDVALSDYVYSGDTVTGVTNNSTRDYEVPQAMWLNHDMERATASTHTVRLAVMHAHAQQGKPVAAVVFTATDQSANSVSVTVTAMSVASYSATGLSVPHFAATLDLSTLTQGDVVTVDAEIRPWVGEAFTLSTDAATYPSPNLTVLKLLNDRTGAYGTAYAYVDSVGGNNGTAVVSTTPATAAAAPYATVAAAAAGIVTFNTSNFSRANASGGVIRLTDDGSHTHATFGSVATGEIPLVIEADPANAGAAIYTDSGANVFAGIPAKTKFSGVTLRRSTASNIVCLDNGAAVSTSENLLVTEGCTWDTNSLAAGALWVHRVGRFYNINSGGTNLGQLTRSSAIYKAGICIGSGGGSLQRYSYHAVACKDLDANLQDDTLGGGNPGPTGNFYGWNFMGQDTNGAQILNLTRTIDANGVAVVGNVIEHFGGVTAPSITLAASGTAPALNINIFGNTSVGSRTNMIYNDSGTTAIVRQGRSRFNFYLERSTKTDVFGTNGNLTGNWAAVYVVGWRGDTAIEGDSQTDTYGTGEWLGQIQPFDEVAGSNATPVVMDFADDQSFGAGGAGDGDYTPGASYAGSVIAAGFAPWSHDQAGTAIPNNGTGVAGAIQRP